VILAFLKGIADNAYKLADGAAKALIKFLNGLSKAIDDNAAALGKAGGEIAVSIVKGLVNGIGAGIGAVKDAAVNMAKNALSSAKNWLLGNSPSKKFMVLGQDIDKGMVIGIDSYSKYVGSSAENLAATALNTVKDSMSGLADALSGEVDLNPVIAPVLDLDAFRKKALEMSDILAPKSIAPTTSAQNATSIAAAAEVVKQNAAVEQLAATGTTLEFNQYNNSPKALSSSEIYRQTKNQLSIVKGALPK